MRLTKFADLTARVAGGRDRDGAGDGPVVVLMHGFGAPGDDLVPLERVLHAPPGTRFVFPEAPFDLGPAYDGGRAWWWVDLEERFRRRAAGEPPDTEGVPGGLPESREKVLALLGEVVRALQPPAGKLIIGGFSQGAMLALDVALHGSDAIAGVVMMSGTRVAGSEWAARIASRRGTPVFMSHGDSDELLPFAVSEQLRAALVTGGLPVDWVPFHGGHAIPPAVVAGVGTFLLRTLTA